MVWLLLSLEEKHALAYRVSSRVGKKSMFLTKKSG
jgi:hypothetical protein